ncbi:hypothetical protein B0H11DRAFT_476117 [Mycena galericulata]|nr:hypothetical protein B0H11DRAFT_476117 [Mycena galericulata]
MASCEHLDPRFLFRFFPSLPPGMSVFIVDVGVDPTSPGGPYQFSPNTLNATSGSTVTFRFSGSPGNHSVTQSTLDLPCTPLPGGLDSGFQSIPTGVTSGFPEWSIAVEDAQQPLYFFCRQSTPVYHCPSGMLFALNPVYGNYGNPYSEFLLNAEEAAPGAVSTGTDGRVTTLYTNAPTETLPAVTVLTTIGHRVTTLFSTPAQTTAAPATSGSAVAVPLSVFTSGGTTRTFYGFEDAAATSTGSQGESTTGQSAPSSVVSAPASSRSSTVPVGAIVGAVLGALVLVSLCIAALFLFLRRRRRRARPGEIRSLGSRPASTVISLASADARFAYPTPLTLPPNPPLITPNEKSSALRTGNITTPGSTSTSAGSSRAALPTAAELTLADMTQEVLALRTQVQRLEQGHHARPSGSAESDDDLPPQYAPNAG